MKLLHILAYDRSMTFRLNAKIILYLFGGYSILFFAG